MKIGKKVSKAAPPVKESIYSAKSENWMVTDRKQQKEALDRQKLLSGANRAPELWQKDGESRLIRFRDEGPICCFYAYRLQAGGKFKRFTKPASGPNLFESELGLQPSFFAAYEIVDRSGYTNNEGKQIKDVPRFLIVSGREYKQLEMFRQEAGPLCNFDIKRIRSGAGTDTTYNYVQKAATPMPPELKKLERLSARFKEFYRPLSPKDQAIIVASLKVKSDDPWADED